MRNIKHFFFGLLFLISINGFCQEDSVVVKKFNENYVEIQTLRFKLDSGYSFSDGAYVVKYLGPKSITLKDGIVLIKDRNSKPIQIIFYSDSIAVQRNYYTKGKLYSQEFDASKKDISIKINYDTEQNIDGLGFWFKKSLLSVYYEGNKPPEIKLVDR